MEVVKRDGRVVQYDPSKVRRAVREAFKAVDGELTEDTLKRIEKIAEYVDEFNQPKITVEEIQDFLEQKLMSSNRKDVAKSYIIYRNNRTIEREKNSTIVRKVARRLNPTKAENSNANVDERSFSGKEKEASADVFKTMAIDYEGLSRRVAQAHKDMLVYQHDLEKAVIGEHNCAKSSTLFLTTQGIKSFADFEDGDEVNIYTHLGRVKKAIVKSGGIQQLYKLTFKKGEEFIVEYFTENHRWYLDDTTITDKIKIGDKLLKTPKINVEYVDLDNNVFNDIAELVNIEKDSLEEVWCLQVEDDKSFILASGLVTGNCLFLDFQEIFTNGFQTRNGDVRTPACFSTACQLVAVAFQCQSQVQFGGVASMHLDYDLAPFVKMSFAKHLKDGIEYILTEEEQKDEFLQKLLENKSVNIENEYIKEKYPKLYKYAYNMLLKECKQAAEGLYHNLNTLESRQGSQVPFTSINIGRDITPEGRLVTKCLLEASINGIGKYHLTSIFPISIFSIKAGINKNPGDPNYDLKQLALKSMSKRIYPNWVNGDWSQAHEDLNNPDTYMCTMGCRTMVGKDRHGLGYIRKGRGNNVPCTIILPKIAIEHGICLGQRERPDLDGFWKDLDRALRICEQALLERYAIIKKQSPKAAPFMYQNHTIKGSRDCNETVEEAVKHGTLGMGFIGIAEMCTALFGKSHDEDEEIHNFALSVVEHIYDYAKDAAERNDLNFTCYATPAESLCHTSLKALREQYGVIENVTSHEYLTNSFHVPVWHKVSIYDKLKCEAPFTKYATAGCITYIELESTFVKNTKAVEDIIDYAFSLDIPYLAFNFPIDSCLDCGYQGEFNDCCPECGSKNIQQLRRVTGYITGNYKIAFNDGKQAEVEERVKHSAYTNFNK